METIIVQPDTKEKLNAVKAFLKALKISFKEEKIKKSPYDPKFVAKIKKSQTELNADEYDVIDTKDLWK